MNNQHQGSLQSRGRSLQFSQLILLIGMLPLSQLAMAAEFYTIIGPDGRPMVIQRSTQTDHSIASPTSSSRHSIQSPSQQPVRSSADSTSRVDQIPVAPAVAVSQPPIVRPAVSGGMLSQPDIDKHPPQRSVSMPSTIQPLLKQQPSSSASMSSNASASKETTAQPIPQQLAVSRPPAHLSQANSPFTELDGEKYVDQEYLEENEFNLDGRKRFYMVMDSGQSGAVRFETVERQKGISRTILSKFLKPYESEQLEPLALSTSYARIDKSDVEESLGQACFKGKKMDKAKRLKGKDAELGIWPVPPIREEFAYEVIQIDPAINQIQIQSFASSKKNPTYYWPLVVFLDKKGCVLEGVTGFKSHQAQGTIVKYSALEGVLKKPAPAAYMFITPLAEAVDAQHASLSNRGQLKLKALN